MASVYPKAPEVRPAPPPFDEATCVTRLIALRDARPAITRQLAAGKVIHAVGGTVADVYRVWDEVEAERLACEAVYPADHTTVTKYKTALSACGDHLDATTWYNGMKARHGVSTWAELVDTTTPAEAMEL